MCVGVHACVCMQKPKEDSGSPVVALSDYCITAMALPEPRARLVAGNLGSVCPHCYSPGLTIVVFLHYFCRMVRESLRSA